MECRNCGNEERANAKFCSQCGNPLNKESNIYVSRQNDVKKVQGEEVLAIMDASDKNQGFLQKVITIVLTSRRIIIANKDAKLLSKFHKEHKKALEAEGQKGLTKFLAMASSNQIFMERYRKMPPDTILTESSGNYEFSISQIQKVSINARNNTGSKDYLKIITMVIQANGKKFKYILNEANVNKEIIDILSSLFGAGFDRGNIRYY